MDENSKSDPSTGGDGVEQSEAILRLFAQHQRWLFGYLTALLGSAADADDVFQEVCVIMWREHEKFEVGSNFVSWLSVIAYHQVQRYWREQKKARRTLGDQNLERLAEELPQHHEVMESRRWALPDCLGKLQETDRQLLRECYGERNVTARQVAQETGRPENTVYKALQRIRKSLHQCIDRAIAAES